MSQPDFNSLSEAEKRAVAERLLRIEESGWKPFWCPKPGCSGDPHQLVDPADGAGLWMDETETSGPNGEPLGDVVEFDDGDRLRPILSKKWAHNHARVDQRLPPWTRKWVLMVLSGRGSGKTRTGVEFVTLSARKGVDGIIVGRRGTELENTHVAALMEHAHPEFQPQYLASKDMILWPNGAKTYLFSAERPENIRSVNVSYVWFDEAAHMDEVETAWMNAKLACRIETPGNPLHFLITSTPTPTKWVMEMEDDPDVEVRRVSTYANRANLSADFLADMRKKYEGTRMGRQELHGEVLRDVEGAMWTDDLFSHLHVDASGFAELVESMDDRVLAIDPAGSKGPRSDETGIIGGGAQHFDDDGNRLARSNLFVLARASLKGSPTEWAAQAFKAAHLIDANRIVAEKNFGGDMVAQVLGDYAATHPEDPNTRDSNGDPFKVDVVRAQQSKETRAEPVVGRYEQGTVTHVTSPTVFGDLSELEKQQTTWVPKSRGGRMPSPNDVDALVWMVRALETKVRFESSSAHQGSVLKKLRRRRAG